MEEKVAEKRSIPYAKQSIDQTDLKALVDAFDGDFITRGPRVEEFEKALAEYCEVEYAILFNSGSSALQGAYFSLDITPADRVLSTPNSFVASVAGALQEGGRVQFVDIDRSTGNIDLCKLEEALEGYYSTRGKTVITPVHFSGIPVQMDQLEQLIKDPNTAVIEDACHALGGAYSTGEKIGSCKWSDMTVFSFHPAKTITCGEGGAVTTNDRELYERLSLYRNNGIVRFPDQPEKPWLYEVQELTGNYNVTEFQAALAHAQLLRLDLFVEKRRDLVRRYREAFKGIKEVSLFSDLFDHHTAFHLFVVQIDFEKLQKSRGELMLYLKERGIGTQVHYIPIYHHPVIRNIYGDLEEKFPEMERYYNEALSLPLYPEMEEEDVDWIVSEVRSFIG